VNDELKEALDGIQKIIDEALKNYTHDERKQIAEELIKNYRAGNDNPLAEAKKLLQQGMEKSGHTAKDIKATIKNEYRDLD